MVMVEKVIGIICLVRLNSGGNMLRKNYVYVLKVSNWKIVLNVISLVMYWLLLLVSWFYISIIVM